MNRLPAELDRLFGSGVAGTGPPSAAHGRRAAVLEVALPAGWAALSTVWKGVQTELELPAPAIALSGVDALQLWFAFASPASPAARGRLVRGLCARWLPGLPSAQVRVFVDGAGFPMLPPAATGPQRWSAFVTPDLASIFGETPWLDIPPGDDAQATILHALAPISSAAFEAALHTLEAIEAGVPRQAVAVAQRVEPAAPTSPAAREGDDPARFLTGVMNDETAPLALRIEAARILLEHGARS